MFFLYMKAWTLFSKNKSCIDNGRQFRSKGKDDRNPLCSNSKLLMAAVVYHGVSSKMHRQWYFQTVAIPGQKKAKNVRIDCCLLAYRNKRGKH